ncbi:MAG: hypothetical protein MUF61_00105 [archaeon]|jgi:hypothetical protein|nr:hypothetical protein [archaeon]
MAISCLFFVFLISLSSALSFTVSCPEEAELNESFSVSISAAASDIYDVKIVIMDNSSQKIISQIYNEGWKNPYYYIKSAFPSKTEFEVRATDYSENAVICSRLRKEGATSYTEVCQKISLIAGEKEADEDEESDAGEDSESESAATERVLNKSPGEDFVPSSNQDSSFQELLQEASGEKTLLNPASQITESYISNDEKVRLGIAYAFAAICIVVVILISLRKI